MNHHEIEAEVQTTDVFLFLDHRKDDPQKYSKSTEYNFKFKFCFFEPGQSPKEPVASWSREAATDINSRYKTDPQGSLVSECQT